MSLGKLVHAPRPRGFHCFMYGMLSSSSTSGPCYIVAGGVCIVISASVGGGGTLVSAFVGGVCIIVSASIGGVCMELSTSHGVCIEDSELLPAMFSLTPHLSSPLKCRD